MAIEIIPKPKIEIKKWATVFLVISIAFTVAAIIFYFVTSNFSKKIKADILQKKQALEKTSEESSLESRISEIQYKIESFKTLLSQHKKSENAIVFLEQKCHPKVWFNKFDFNSENTSIKVSGIADDFVVLEQQMQILKKDKLIRSVNLSGISLSKEGEALFSLSLVLDPQILK